MPILWTNSTYNDTGLKFEHMWVFHVRCFCSTPRLQAPPSHQPPKHHHRQWSLGSPKPPPDWSHCDLCEMAEVTPRGMGKLLVVDFRFVAGQLGRILFLPFSGESRITAFQHSETPWRGRNTWQRYVGPLTCYGKGGKTFIKKKSWSKHHTRFCAQGAENCFASPFHPAASSPMKPRLPKIVLMEF